MIATFIEPTSPHRKDIEIKVDVNAESVAELIIRRNIAGITVRISIWSSLRR